MVEVKRLVLASVPMGKTECFRFGPGFKLSPSAHDAAVQMIDTSIVVDTNGRPVRLALTAGEAHDNRLAGKRMIRPLQSGA